MAHFIVVLKRGSAWQWSLPMRRQAEWESHAAFMDALTDDHTILAGGPLGNEDTAARVLLILEASDATAAAARLQEDPWSPLGLLELVSIEPWTVLLGRADMSERRVSSPMSPPSPLPLASELARRFSDENRGT